VRLYFSSFTLSLHDALPIFHATVALPVPRSVPIAYATSVLLAGVRLVDTLTVGVHYMPDRNKSANNIVSYDIIEPRQQRKQASVEARSEERRVGKECRTRRATEH